MKVFFYICLFLVISSCDLLNELDNFSAASTKFYSSNPTYEKIHFCGEFHSESECEISSKQYNLDCGYADDYCWDKDFADYLNKKDCSDYKSKHDCNTTSKLDGLDCKYYNRYCYEADAAQRLKRKYYCFQFTKEAKCNNALKTDNINCEYYKKSCSDKDYVERMKKYENSHNNTGYYRTYTWEERVNEAKKAEKQREETLRKEKEESDKYCLKIRKQYGEDFRRMALKLHPDRVCNIISKDSKKKEFDECHENAKVEFQRAAQCYGK